MKVDLSGRVAVVTGASTGIGRGIASSLAGAGATVVIADLDDQPPTGEAETTRETIEAAGGRARFIETDVADFDAVRDLVEAVTAEFGGLDILVNNAGISHRGTIDETEPEVWQRVLDVNLTGIYNGVHHALPHLKASDAPRIVNIASQLAFVAQPEKPAYLASKGGVVSLTRAIALDHADVPVLANAVCPGVVRSELTREVLADDERRAFYESQTPLPYLGEPEDIGSMVAFLASDHARFITGQSFVVDGGYTIR